MIKSTFGFQGSVHIEHCSSVVADVILTFGGLCSGLACAPDFGNPCDYSRRFGHSEWCWLVQEVNGIGRTYKGIHRVF